VVSALWPDLADYVEDTITIGGKARPHHTGKCDVHLWCQWREAKDRLAELIESIAGSKPGGAATDQVAQAAKPPKTITEPPAPPAKLLASWGEILEALGLKKKDRNKVARLNRTRGGPIKPGKKGQQPIVDHAELLEWWNRLTIEYEVGENRRRDAKPTAAASHEHGRDGVVLPDIGGSERKRRADRKP
jgi:hypothetical protein